MPGATDTDFFARADMLDTKVAVENKDDPADVAKAGFKAMMEGKGDVVTGLKNKFSTMAAAVTPSGMLAEQHRKLAEPGSAKKWRDSQTQLRDLAPARGVRISKISSG
jgi:short-subunit dehydrogenase